MRMPKKVFVFQCVHSQYFNSICCVYRIRLHSFVLPLVADNTNNIEWIKYEFPLFILVKKKNEFFFVLKNWEKKTKIICLTLSRSFGPYLFKCCVFIFACA